MLFFPIVDPPTELPYTVARETTTVHVSPVTSPKQVESETTVRSEVTKMMESETTMRPEVTYSPQTDHGKNKCPRVEEGELHWPPTRAGETRRIKCQDGLVGMFVFLLTKIFKLGSL